jgi:hypothetical protein
VPAARTPRPSPGRVAPAGAGSTLLLTCSSAGPRTQKSSGAMRSRLSALLKRAIHSSMCRAPAGGVASQSRRRRSPAPGRAARAPIACSTTLAPVRSQGSEGRLPTGPNRFRDGPSCGSPPPTCSASAGAPGFDREPARRQPENQPDGSDVTAPTTDHCASDGRLVGPRSGLAQSCSSGQAAATLVGAAVVE